MGHGPSSGLGLNGSPSLFLFFSGFLFSFYFLISFISFAFSLEISSNQLLFFSSKNQHNILKQ
jgi:hypothetical protein